MNPEHQRVAIAKALPWKQINYLPGKVWFPVEGSMREIDPLSDLNAMHSAEQALGLHDGLQSDKARRFAWILWRIASEDDVWQDDTDMVFDFSHFDLTAVISATAAQRAEAFLRTLNLWTE